MITYPVRKKLIDIARRDVGDERVVNFHPDHCSVTVLRSSGGRLELVRRGAEAATRVELPAATLSVAGGRVIHFRSGRSLPFADLVPTPPPCRCAHSSRSRPP